MAEFEIDIHLGAHKTASSLIQKTLFDHQEVLLGDGILYRGPNQLRAYFPQQNFEETIPKDIKFGRVFLSDENFMGYTSDIGRTETLYQDLTTRLATLGAWLPQEPRRIYISIRDYFNFVPSAIAQGLSTPSDRIVNSNQTREAFLEMTRRWPQIIDEIRNAFPNSEIIIWRYEELHQKSEKIMAHLVGETAAKITLDLSKEVHRSLSVEAHEFLRQGISLGINGINLRRFLRNNPIEHGTSFRDIFWHDDDEEVTRAIYERDLDMIREGADAQMRLLF